MLASGKWALRLLSMEKANMNLENVVQPYKLKDESIGMQVKAFVLSSTNEKGPHKQSASTSADLLV